MASIWKRQQNGKQTWVARWYEPEGGQRARSFTRKVDAETWLLEVEHAKRSGSYVSKNSGGEITVASWAPQWLDSKLNLKPSTRHRYAVLIRTNVLPALGARRLDQLRHSDVARWMARLSDRLSASTVRQSYVILSQMLDMAVADQRISTNPAKGIEKPRLRRDAPNPFTWEQLLQLADEVGPRHRAQVLVLGTAGLRFGELAGLLVGGVDLERRRLHVQENLVEVAGRLVVVDPKDYERRAVPLAAVAAPEVAALTEGRSPDARLFLAPSGGPLRLNNWRARVFEPAVRRMGLAGKTPHDLRDTAATLAIKAGASVKDVQQMLGHASAVMTLDRYAGWFDDGLDELAERMDRSHVHWSGTEVQEPKRGRGAGKAADLG